MRRASTEPRRSKAARSPPRRLRHQNHSEPASQATQKPPNGGLEVLPPQLVMTKWGSASTRVMEPVMSAAGQSLTLAETAAVVKTAAVAAAAAAAVTAVAVAAVVTAAAAVAAEIGHA